MKVRNTLLLVLLVTTIVSLQSVCLSTSIIIQQSIHDRQALTDPKVFGSNPESEVSQDPTEHEPIEIISNQGFVTLGFPGSGIIEDPYIISNLIIEVSINSDYTPAIHISNVDTYFIISNCYLSTEDSNGIIIEATEGFVLENNEIYAKYGGTGIHVGGSDGFIIRNNLIGSSMDFLWHGIYIDRTSNSIVENNIIYADGEGIRIDGSNFIIRNNSIFGNIEGLDSYWGLIVHSTNSVISGNILTGWDIGILLYGTYNSLVQNNCSQNYIGIELSSSSQNTISNNSVSNNLADGIHVYSNSLYNNISRNWLEGNGEYGVSFVPYTPTMTFFPTAFPEHNQVYANIFIDNNGGGPQASDRSGGNIFAYNYWSDQLIRLDSNGDGIVDTSHTVDGISVIDTNPLVDESFAYSIPIVSIPITLPIFILVQRNILLLSIGIPILGVVIVRRMYISKDKRSLFMKDQMRVVSSLFLLQIGIGLFGVIYGMFILGLFFATMSLLLVILGPTLFVLSFLDIVTGVRLYLQGQESLKNARIINAIYSASSIITVLFFISYLSLSMLILNGIIFLYFNYPRFSRNYSSLEARGESIHPPSKTQQDNIEVFLHAVNRGKQMVSEGQLDEAKELFTKVTQDYPQETDGWRGLGFTFIKLAAFKEAIIALDKALELDPQIAECWYNKARAHVGLSEKDEAIDALEKAISLSEQARELAKGDAGFDSLREDPSFRQLIEE